jgi:hypothetical protein
MATIPRSGTCHACRSTLSRNVKLSLTAYLRAAHAYMLISMPTGTSTIFGVFQAILALLLNRTKFRPADKLVAIKKFASEIFCPEPQYLMLHRERKSLDCAGVRPNQKRINQFKLASLNPEADVGPKLSDTFRIKNS